MGYRITTSTICFNNLEELKRTIASVDKQNSKPYQHLIVDGSTNNAIKDFLESTEHPDYREWISEPDEGITDGFNKGVYYAKGDIVHLLNSGDMYYDETVLEREYETFQKNPEIQWTHGQYLQYMGGQWVITGQRFNPSKLYRGFRKVGHPTMFVKKAMYEKHGYFDKAFRHSMDFDFLMRIRNEPFYYIQYPITIFTPGGNSNVNWKAAYDEVVKSYVRHKGWDWRILWGYCYQMLFYPLMQTALGRWLMKQKNKKRIQDEPTMKEE